MQIELLQVLVLFQPVAGGLNGAGRKAVFFTENSGGKRGGVSMVMSLPVDLSAATQFSNFKPYSNFALL
jgi:hypothetical protein